MYIVDQQRLVIEAIKVSPLELRQVIFDMVVIEVLFQIFRIVEIAIRKIRRNGFTAAAGMGLCDLHQLLSPQDLRIFDDMPQGSLFAFAVPSV